MVEHIPVQYETIGVVPKQTISEFECNCELLKKLLRVNKSFGKFSKYETSCNMLYILVCLEGKYNFEQENLKLQMDVLLPILVTIWSKYIQSRETGC